MLAIYEDKMLLLWIAFIAVGAIVWWLNRRGSRVLMAVSALLIAAPFIWPSVYLLREQDAAERAEQLLAVWPLWLVLGVVALAKLAHHLYRRRRLAQSGIDSCTHGTPIVSSTTATGTMTFFSATGQSANYIVTLVKEGNTWKIDDLTSA